MIEKLVNYTYDLLIDYCENGIIPCEISDKLGMSRVGDLLSKMSLEYKVGGDAVILKYVYKFLAIIMSNEYEGLAGVFDDGVLD